MPYFVQKLVSKFRRNVFQEKSFPNLGKNVDFAVKREKFHSKVSSRFPYSLLLIVGNLFFEETNMKIIWRHNARSVIADLSHVFADF